MADIVDSATRSRMMAGIRAKNTKPEVIVRSLLHRAGFRFRLHAKHLPGKPDIVFRRYKAVVLVHGCFWHGHDCPLFKWPATRPDFWKNKIGRNQLNDRRSFELLIEQGWRIAVVWECALRGRERNLEEVTRQLAAWLRGSNTEVIELASPMALPRFGMVVADSLPTAPLGGQE
ncbi:DNA mismatch endonuclease Vsr [Oxalobacteraceae sp. CFBP 13708]|nr:DNA mismatch endonuclease Vsr [Oxalobacteraceae sp. CFBP 13708]